MWGVNATECSNEDFVHRPAERYALFMLRDCLIAWEYGTRPGNNWFAPGQSFREYAEPFTVSWRFVLPESIT